jgi:hypothetical protein
MKNFSRWNEDTIAQAISFITCLVETADAWAEFRRSDIHYFTSDTDESRSRSLKSLDNTFAKMGVLLSSLERLKTRLEANRPLVCLFSSRSAFFWVRNNKLKQALHAQIDRALASESHIDVVKIAIVALVRPLTIVITTGYAQCT